MCDLALVACAAPAYLERTGVPAEPAALREHDVIHYAHNATGHDWRFDGPDGASTRVTVHPRLTTNNGSIMRGAALDGYGIAILPRFVVEDDLAAGTLREVLPGWRPPVARLKAVLPRRREVVPKTRLLVAHLRERFAALGLAGAAAAMTRCWLVTDEAAGNQRQAEALARAMGLEAEAWTLRLRAPWSWWAPRFERHAAARIAAGLRARRARGAARTRHRLRPRRCAGHGLAARDQRLLRGADPRSAGQSRRLGPDRHAGARRPARRQHDQQHRRAQCDHAGAPRGRGARARDPGAPAGAAHRGAGRRLHPRGAPRRAMAGLAARHPRRMAGARRRQLPGQRLAPHPGAAGGAIARGLRGLARHGCGLRATRAPIPTSASSATRSAWW